MRIRFLTVILLSILVCAISCSATKVKNTAKSKKTKIESSVDTVMVKALGDSISDIIINAKSIEMGLIPSPEDSVSTVKMVKVPAKDKETVMFVITNPKNYLSDAAVYGQFIPQLEVLYVKKKTSVRVKYDFGLKKWGVFDANDKAIALYDLESDNMLRFACKMYPEDTFLRDLLMFRDK